MPALDPGVSGTVAPWCDVDSVANDERVKAATLPDGVTHADCVQAASEELYKASGCRWAGLRTDTIRWRWIVAEGLGWWLWSDAIDTRWNRQFPEGWALGSPTTLDLPGPVTDVGEVLVDGAVLDPSAYVLYDNHRLVRVDGKSWPLGQTLDVATTEVGTFSVTFTHGAAPPTAGMLAGREWSIQKVLFVSTNRDKLPQRTTSITRNGVKVEVERGDQLEKGKVGIPLVDTFLAFYNPKRLSRRARSYSVDSPEPAISSSNQP